MKKPTRPEWDEAIRQTDQLYQDAQFWGRTGVQELINGGVNLESSPKNISGRGLMMHMISAEAYFVEAASRMQQAARIVREMKERTGENT